MARSRRRSGSRRFSRPLVAVMTVGVTGLALVLWFNPMRGPSAADAGPAEASETPSAVASAPAATAASAVTVRPTPTATPRGPVPVVPSTRPASAAPAVNATAPRQTFLADAARLRDEGKLLDARRVLNDALQSGRLDDKTGDDVKKQMRDLNQAIVFTPTRRFADDPFQGEHTIQPGENLSRIARPHDIPFEFLARVNGISPNRIRAGQSLKTIKGPVHGVVCKNRFTLDLYLGALPGEKGSMYLTTYYVGLGEDSSTPTGTWEVTRGSKLVNPEWTNPRSNEVIRSGDPTNPLGVRWLGLTGIAGDAVGQPSYGIHGTIEPQTIGTNASMGCIRLLNQNVVEVYDMLVEGRSTILVID